MGSNLGIEINSSYLNKIVAMCWANRLAIKKADLLEMEVNDFYETFEEYTRLIKDG